MKIQPIINKGNPGFESGLGDSDGQTKRWRPNIITPCWQNVAIRPVYVEAKLQVQKRSGTAEKSGVALENLALKLFGLGILIPF
jgi:hypothetical protein